MPTNQISNISVYEALQLGTDLGRGLAGKEHLHPVSLGIRYDDVAASELAWMVTASAWQPFECLVPQIVLAYLRAVSGELRSSQSHASY